MPTTTTSLREQVEDSVGHDIDELAKDAEKALHCAWPSIVIRILAIIDAHEQEDEQVRQAYQQAIRDLGSSPEAQANIAVTLLTAENKRLLAIEEAARALADRMKVGHNHPSDAPCIPACPRWWRDAIIDAHRCIPTVEALAQALHKTHAIHSAQSAVCSCRVAAAALRAALEVDR